MYFSLFDCVFKLVPYKIQGSKKESTEIIFKDGQMGFTDTLLSPTTSGCHRPPC